MGVRRGLPVDPFFLDETEFAALRGGRTAVGKGADATSRSRGDQAPPGPLDQCLVQVVVLRRSRRELGCRLGSGRGATDIAFVAGVVEWRSARVVGGPSVAGDALTQRAPFTAGLAKDVHPVAAQNVLGVEDDVVAVMGVDRLVFQTGRDGVVGDVAGSVVLDQSQALAAKRGHSFALAGGVREFARLVQGFGVARVGHLGEVVLER